MALNFWSAGGRPASSAFSRSSSMGGLTPLSATATRCSWSSRAEALPAAIAARSDSAPSRRRANPAAIAVWSRPAPGQHLDQHAMGHRPPACRQQAGGGLAKLARRGGIAQDVRDQRLIPRRVDRHQGGQRGGPLRRRRRGPLRDRSQRRLEFLELEAAGQLDSQVDLPGIAGAQEEAHARRRAECIADREAYRVPGIPGASP